MPPINPELAMYVDLGGCCDLASWDCDAGGRTSKSWDMSSTGSDSDDVTRVIGGSVGGREDELDDFGRASGDVASCEYGGWGCKGEGSQCVVCSGPGDVGFDGPRRWKRR
jgi:hypothetical protein